MPEVTAIRLKPTKGLTLDDPAGDGSTHDLIIGLAAVCAALQASAADNSNAEETHALAMAARVMSDLLKSRLPQ